MDQSNLEPAGKDGGALGVRDGLGRQRLLDHHLVGAPVPESTFTFIIYISWNF